MECIKINYYFNVQAVMPNVRLALVLHLPNVSHAILDIIYSFKLQHVETHVHMGKI